MTAISLSCIIFALLVGGTLLGTVLRRALPEHHLSKESQDVIRLGVGLIATISALVLGLLIAAAKGAYDNQSNHLKQITADLILLDNQLALFGQGAVPLRSQLRAAVRPFADKLWQESAASQRGPFEANAAVQQAYLAIKGLTPQNNIEKSLQAQASATSDDLARSRLMLFVESGNFVPTPFLVILVFWLVIIFASFSLFSKLNVTVFVCLTLFALSASGAIFLILELTDPFKGVMMISSEPLRNALAPL